MSKLRLVIFLILLRLIIEIVPSSAKRTLYWLTQMPNEFEETNPPSV